jgi:hypothetical protein
MRSLLNPRMLGLLAAVVILSAVEAQASLIFTLQEVDDDTIMTGSGTFDLTGLTPKNTFTIDPQIGAKSFFLVGAKGQTFREYDGSVTGPTSIGPGDFHTALASSGTGDLFGLSFMNAGIGALALPIGYVSGQALFGTAFYDHVGLLPGGITPGTYVWTFGNGETVTLDAIGRETVPEPTTLALVATGILGLASRRRRIACA